MRITVGLKDAANIANLYKGASENLQQRMENRIEAAMRIVQREAMRESPVDTGKLRQSIRFQKVAPMTGEVEVTADYGVYVHEGTRYFSGNPFMDRAIVTAQPKISAEFGMVLQATVRDLEY